MREERGNMFEPLRQAVAITTNGFVTHDGRCVMGRGNALEAARRWSGIEYLLGSLILERGNVVHHLGVRDGTHVFSFPVKPRSVVSNGSNIVSHMSNKFPEGRTAPGWAARADIGIIRSSAVTISALATQLGLVDVVIPRPGVGAGELMWSDVRPVIEDILDDRFTIIHL